LRADAAFEAVDPAASILAFCETHHVDHIIIGAGQGSRLRSLLGGVSSKVAGEAGCSVTVVRPPRLASKQSRDGERPDAIGSNRV
jgi:nucleotide-binding universal stress UspA family protein